LALLLLAASACATRTTPNPIERDAADSGTVRLTVRILGLESGDGAVAIALYDSAESFDSRSGAVAAGRVRPTDGAASWTIWESLAPGRYAVAAYHDLNDNGRLDRPAIGPPTEPYGFSNDARGTFGPPRFDKAAIVVGPGPRTIEITLR